MKFKFFILLLFFVVSLPVFAEEDHFCLDGLGEPKTYINSCVNASNGAYIYSFPDLIVDGPEPISFCHHFSSKNFKDYGFGKGFIHDHDTHLEEANKETVFLKSGGDKIAFVSKVKGDEKWYHFKKKQLKFGVTNCAMGEISARNNIINTKIFVKKDGERIVVAGDGSRKYYNTDSHLVREVRPSGNVFLYNYGEGGCLKKISATDPTEQIEFGWMAFNYGDDKIFVNASNGKEAVYALSQGKYHKILKSSQVTGIPLCQFNYRKDRLRSIEWEGGNFISRGDHLGKGKSLYYPGTDGKPFKTHKISYFRKRTSVIDSEGGKSIYHFSRRRRLECKERRKNGTLYSLEFFFWREKSHGSGVKSDEGNLVTRGIGKEGWAPLTLTTYQYDTRGNVLEETIAGHLTGYTPPDFFELDPWGRPYLEGREHYSRRYTYTDDGFNLPLTMEEDDGLKKTWTYLEGTSKPKTQFLYAGEKIVGREFFSYNAFGLLIERINDDGCSLEKNSLLEVTKRVITRIKPNIFPGTSGVGKPLKITESYWDPKIDNEQVLKTVTYTYGIYDLVTAESHFGSEGEHLYTLSYEYDRSGNKIKEVDLEGRITFFSYNEANQCIYKEIIGSGLAIYYIYDQRGRLIKEEKRYDTGDTFLHTYQYDSLDRKIVEMDPYGGRTTFTYDTLGRLVKIAHPSFMGKEGIITPIEKKKYNIWDQVVEESDAAGFSTKKSYNARGQVTEITYPDGSCERYRYYLNGTLEKKEYPNGSYTLLSYDALKHPIKEETFDQQGILLRERQYIYQGDSLIEEIDPAGNITTYEYDGAGRRTAKVAHGEGKSAREEYFYNALGKLYLAKKWYGEASSDYISYFLLHDNVGRLIEERIEDSAGVVCSRKTFAYDLNGNCIEEAIYQEEGKAAISRTQYAPYNLPVLAIDSLGVETRYSYDLFYENGYGQQVIKVTIIAPNGVQTVIEKDPAGRDAAVAKFSLMGQLLSSEKNYYEARGLKELQVVDAVANGKKLREYWVAWDYDKRGHPVKIQEDPLGRNKCTRVSYNQMGQIQSKTKPDGTVLTYTYDPLAREIACGSSDESFGYTYTYDSFDQMVESKDLEGRVLSRIHDAFGNLISETLPNDLTVSYAYDNLKRLTCLRFPDGSTSTYHYDSIYLRSVTRQSANQSYTHHYQACDWQGRSIQSRLITGDTVNFSWDLAGRLRSMTSSHCSEVVPEGGYDLMGNLVQVEMTLPGISKTERYSYDALNQLTREDSLEVHEYANDSLYNRLVQDDRTYQINPLNQVENDGIGAYAYDSNGNIQNGDGRLYQFDAFNRLIGCEKTGEWKAEYVYDSFGRRITSRHFKSEGTSWILEDVSHFLYQGMYEIGRFDDAGNAKELRVMGKQEGAVFRLAIAVELSGVVYAPLYDHRFNVIALVGWQSQEPVEIYRYTAFGKVEIRGPSGEVREKSLVSNPWAFANQRLDHTGLYCMGKRYYNVELGRWISPDPGDFIDGMNLYAYTHNRPLVYADFLGFSSKSIFGKGWLGSIFRTVLEIIGIVSYDLQNGFNAGRRLGAALSETDIPRIKCSLFNNTHCSTGHMGGGDFPAACVLIVTGIACENENTKGQAEVVSGYLNGTRAYYFCHETKGIPIDLGISAAELFKFKKSAIDGLAKTIVDHFKRMEERRGGKDVRMYLIPQSRGGIECYWACERLDPEMKRRIIVMTYGSGELIPPRGLERAENIMNSRDLVGLFSRFVNAHKEMMRTMELGLNLMGEGVQNGGFEFTRHKLSQERPNLTFTGYSSSPFPFPSIADHYFSSKGYDDNLQKFCREIVKEEAFR